MPKYLDGIQLVEDISTEYMVLASGTITTTTQYPTTPNINRPKKFYKNYSLLMSNKSGQSIAGVNALLQGDSTIVPNSNAVNFYANNTADVSTAPSTVLNNQAGSSQFTAELFVLPSTKIQFNLSAVPTSGTIDWALIGY
jgi:hypothetical protein